MMSEHNTETVLREESAEWLNMDDFSVGIDANRVAPSKDLAGRALVT